MSRVQAKQKMKSNFCLKIFCFIIAVNVDSTHREEKKMTSGMTLKNGKEKLIPSLVPHIEFLMYFLARSDIAFARSLAIRSSLSVLEVFVTFDVSFAACW